MSALATAGVNKKQRKKSETKPQAQINKCNNEKRRREQENIYIEELAELISANFADMSSLSVKPDKCAILQETVNQIRSIKQREGAAQSSDPVQQGEVSSSRPTILSNEVYGPLLLEALEGFLFVVNGEGKVEHVTDNVATYIKFTSEEVLGKSIYNFIHHGDHARFSSSLLPMTIGWDNQPTNRSRSFNIRLLVKPPDDQDESVEEKQQRVSCYELMHISSTQLRDQVAVAEDDGSDSGPCLLCVASRISHRDKSTCSIEQFTTKLDTSGKVICVDTSGVSPTIAHYIKKDLMDRVLRDLVPTQEVHKVNVHLREVLTAGQSTSQVYRLQIGQDKLIQVQTKSKLFKQHQHTTTDTDFIMATHSIIGENDAIGPSDPGGGTSSSSVGGPLMTSVVNGTRNGPPVSSGSDSSTTSSTNNALLSTNTPSFSTAFNLDNEFNISDIFHTSNWELDSTNWPETRPDSRHSVTPVTTPTPRPPSNPAYSPATTIAQSPLAQFVTQPSPTVPNPSTPANPYGSTFPFSPLNDQSYSMEEQKDTKANVLEEATTTMVADSNKLRNLLTQKPPSQQVDSQNDADRKDRILKDLLNQHDDDRSDSRGSPRMLISRGSMPGTSETPKTSTSGGNNMLRKLLNDKSDDDDIEVKAGMKKRSELLHQLLKSETREEENKRNEHGISQEDSLLRNLGFPPSPVDGETARARKRPSDERDENPCKRSADGSQVSSSGSSKLCERNKMLVSLLATKPSDHHQPIPPIPASVISATPQEKLPRIVPEPNLNKNIHARMTNSSMSTAQQQAQQSLMNMNRANQQPNRLPLRPQNTTNYLNTILSVQNNASRTGQLNQANSGCYTSPATSSTDNNNIGVIWDNNNITSGTDSLLSDILDQVIDIVPENIMQELDNGNGQQANILSETMAINIIQRSLMQVESVVKNPSSPISLPGTPPAYSSANMTIASSMFQPPPPNYIQASYVKQRVQRPGVQYVTGGKQQQQQLLLHQRQQQLHQLQQQQQEQQKRRLLQQQQQQQLLIPSNAAASEINSMQNIDSLLNNTVAPNVSLQRSSSLPDTQLSPTYGGQLSQTTQRVSSQQQPYSPHAQLPSPQQSAFPQTTSVGNYQQAQLSPQSQFPQQMSPRQAYPQGNSQTANWQQTQPRLSIQQNPMLNAQLTRAPQQQRPINSPGTVSRQSSFQADQFPNPTSPQNASFNQGQYLRIQRANSAPTATTQLPGGQGSPRPYSGREHLPPHPQYPQLPVPPIPQSHPMMYQHQNSSQYSYDQTSLHFAYNGADRGRVPPQLQPAGVSGSGPIKSEYVRQELRAVVGARTAQAQPTVQRPPSQLLNQQQLSELDGLVNFEMASGASDSPKLWGAMGSDMGSMSPQPAASRGTMEEVRPGDHKSSLLQKLLSE